ncbi:branched-chain amino acid ABC transporter substrate-binding protein [Micromonospora cathayae]|uniref:Branched-chain amino acid ABC transporter substrate-binding protein n=1 Tax=Micromonospora cathayae TaxID=3028804 RepID=A0ABY7ZMG7_9ACTN|nr:branched-chain amino acid ABC transporter substrate-binding protein [Micromonospora sp. HUAS 3]WDZ83457.1 branched-chain amino acid ABC transporter substrate-binding protein [Micromonospora sp. HUAS 3]
MIRKLRSTGTGLGRRAVVVTATLPLLALAACQGAEAESGGDGPIRIGVLAPTSGSVSADGEGMVRATRLVVDKVNAEGGIGGRQIELVIADDACEAQAGTQAAQKLVNDKVVAIVGGFCSSATLPAIELFHRNGDLPFVVAVSSNPKVTDAGYPNITRYIGRDDQEAPVLTTYVIDQLKSTKLAIMNDNTEFSRSVAQNVEKNVKTAGGTQIVYNDSIQPGQNDYRAALERVRTTGADTLLYTGFYPEFGVLAKQWKSLNQPYQIVGGASSIDLSVIKSSPEAARDERFSIVSYPTASLLDNAKATAFREAYRKAYNAEPAQYDVFQYDATEGLVAALKENPDDLSTEALNKRLRALSFEGITGQISFDDRGDRKAFPFLAVRAKDDTTFGPVFQFAPDGGWAAVGS